MSSRSEIVARGGSVALFVLILGASAFAYHVITPITGGPPTAPELKQAVTEGTRWLLQAKRPYDAAILCDPLKAYAPDLVELGKGGVTVSEAEARPVILCERGARDYPDAISRAQRDGLGWVRRVQGTRLTVFARDEEAFRASMRRAGMPDAARAQVDKAPARVMLERLRSDASGVAEQADGSWRVPAHPDDGLVLYGPYLDLGPGRYRVRLHVRMRGMAAECDAAFASFRAAMAITKDTGRGGLGPWAPVRVEREKGPSCAANLVDEFEVGAGGAKQVETPFRAPSAQPFIVDDYALDVLPAAQSR